MPDHDLRAPQERLRMRPQRLRRELHSGRWELTGPVYWLYATDAASASRSAAAANRSAPDALPPARPR